MRRVLLNSFLMMVCVCHFMTFAPRTLHALPAHTFTYLYTHQEDSGEYAILEVIQSGSGRIKLNLHVSSDANAYYSGQSIETTNEGVIRIKEKTGTIIALTTEVDALNYMARQGWKIAGMYQVKVLGNDVIRYILEKK